MWKLPTSEKSTVGCGFGSQTAQPASKSQETKPLSFEFQFFLKILKNFENFKKFSIFWIIFGGARQLRASKSQETKPLLGISNFSSTRWIWYFIWRKIIMIFWKCFLRSFWYKFVTWNGMQTQKMHNCKIQYETLDFNFYCVLLINSNFISWYYCNFDNFQLYQFSLDDPPAIKSISFSFSLDLCHFRIHFLEESLWG